MKNRKVKAMIETLTGAKYSCLVEGFESKKKIQSSYALRLNGCPYNMKTLLMLNKIGE